MNTWCTATAEFVSMPVVAPELGIAGLCDGVAKTNAMTGWRLGG